MGEQKWAVLQMMRLGVQRGGATPVAKDVRGWIHLGGTMELDGVLGTDLLLDQEVQNFVAVVALKLKDSSVFRMVHYAAIAAEELLESLQDSLVVEVIWKSCDGGEGFS